MSQYIFFPANNSAVLRATAEALKSRGYGVVDHPCASVTHLLLPVPSFEANGAIKGGGSLEALLAQLPETVSITGGFLSGDRLTGRRCFDLMQDPIYVAENAAITAHCALCLAMEKLPVTLSGCPVLILGWGRIGKCLAKLLQALGAAVTIAARKQEDRAMAHALGYQAYDLNQLDRELNHYRLIFNTIPAPVLSSEQILHCRNNCLKIDLASQVGIAAQDVLWARGLPGKDAPESSGKLIAKTIIRLIGRKEQQV